MTDELVKVAEDSVRGGFFLISGTALATIILAVVSIFVARLLGDELYGQYTLSLVAPQLLFLFTDLGINQGIIKFTASLRSKGETTRIIKIIKYGLLTRTATGIAIFAINYAFAEQFATILLQRPDLTFYLRIASTSVLFHVMFTTAGSAFIGLDKTEYHALTTNINALAKAATSIPLVLLGFGVIGAIVGHVASYAVAAVAAMSIVFLITREKQSLQDNTTFSDALKTLMRYGAPLYIAFILTGFIPIYQNIVLANFTTDADIGNYKAAANFIALLAVLAVPITTVLLPAFSKLDSTGQKVIAFFKLANKYTAMIIVPLVVLMAVYSNEIVNIVYGPTWESAPLFLAMYSTLYLLVGLGFLTLASLFNGLAETRTTLKMSLIIFITLAALSPILTNAYSVPGLITAYLIAATAGTTYGAYIARKRFRIEYDTPSLIKIYLISIMSSIPSLLMLHLMHMPGILNVAIGGTLYLLSYATLVPLTKIVTRQELEIAAQIAQKNRLLALVAKPLLKYEQRILRTRTNV